MIQLPYPVPGKFYRSEMPYSAYDPAGEIFTDYLEAGISLIVLLASDEECHRKTGRNLRELYSASGMEVVHLPIEDFNIPDKPSLDSAMDKVMQHAALGGSAAIHCHAGIGRTGLFAACLAKRLLAISGEEAIRWVRQYIPGAVELPEQEKFVIDFS